MQHVLLTALHLRQLLLLQQKRGRVLLQPPMLLAAAPEPAALSWLGLLLGLLFQQVPEWLPAQQQER